MIGVLMVTAGAIAGLILWYSAACKKANQRKRVGQHYQKMVKLEKARNGRRLLKQYTDRSSESWQAKQKANLFPAGAFHKLVELTHNADTADRLVQNVSERHPARDTLWCVQKAIYDIERDRMAR